jgi:tRNA threonylcarbamoyladenosine biosynthesis protein TsaB
LAPALRTLLDAAGWEPASLGLVAVTVGPGSFTGLRIGVTTAKAVAYATGAELIGVNTLAALAAQPPKSESPLWTIMDAQRGELFVSKFTLEQSGNIVSACDTTIESRGAWLAKLCEGDRVTGPALRRMALPFPSGVTMVPEEYWQPTAVSVGRVGWSSFCGGQRDDVWKLLPQYYRLSAAEEKVARQDASQR